MYTNELEFLKKVSAQIHLKIQTISNDASLDESIDFGLRSFLGIDDDYEHSFRSFLRKIQPNTIYNVSDDFFCNYVVLMFPEPHEPEAKILIIGPYTTQSFSKQDIYRAMEHHQIPPTLAERLLQYYAQITMIPDTTVLQAVFTAFADALWGCSDNYTIKNVALSISETYIGMFSNDTTDCISETKDISYKMRLLEKRYDGENLFMQAIAQGNYHKAEMAFDSSTLFDIELRVSDPIRNLKNYCISMNTILRKAVEQGSVHPIHIDKTSSEFVIMIEAINSLESGKKLMKQMIRKYGLLVKNYSMKDYSLLIQKVIARIEGDLTADQSLHAHAKILNISSGYLSTLFRKETGLTLTEYVNRKRIEYGVFLLNTTDMQIQTVAQHCGISDINYFTKLFKKQIGKTPKEYRQSIC